MTDARVDCAVVIPAYNAAKYLEQTVRSVLEVRGLSLEIVIVDDGSVDDTQGVGVALSASHENIRYLHQHNSGVSSARNAGFAAASADFICFLDSDDCFRPGGLELMREALSKDLSAAAAFGSVTYVDEASRPFGNSPRFGPERGSGYLTLHDLLQSNLIDTPGAVLFRSSALRRSGLFDADIKMGEDWELYVRVARVGRFVYCGSPVVNYRIHPQSAMRRNSGDTNFPDIAARKVFSVDPSYYDLDRKTLRLYEARAQANGLRQKIIRTSDIVSNADSLRRLAMLSVASRDPQVLLMTARSVVSAAKRFRRAGKT